ncbi:unnamed protein product [Rotaria sordida]|uniref:Histone H2A C-terminal domain-containing protein n=1 Tax=Rotaria sordida TaxID=392033 RepID=A0A814QHV0_9BILA|nr:unnamed protein product [Rotaria sordida]CAF1144123.1 unnamed protein product [Rotaria sordida]CAF1411030.1 unnamed protein product [Rotaria sordida]
MSSNDNQPEMSKYESCYRMIATLTDENHLLSTIPSTSVRRALTTQSSDKKEIEQIDIIQNHTTHSDKITKYREEYDEKIQELESRIKAIEEWKATHEAGEVQKTTEIQKNEVNKDLFSHKLENKTLHTKDTDEQDDHDDHSSRLIEEQHRNLNNDSYILYDKKQAEQIELLNSTIIERDRKMVGLYDNQVKHLNEQVEKTESKLELKSAECLQQRDLFIAEKRELQNEIEANKENVLQFEERERKLINEIERLRIQLLKMNQSYTTRLHDSEEQARSLRVRVSRQQDELEERAIVIEQFLADGDRPKKLMSVNLATLTHQYQKLEETNINLTNQLVYEKKLSQGLMCFLDTNLIAREQALTTTQATTANPLPSNIHNLGQQLQPPKNISYYSQLITDAYIAKQLVRDCILSYFRAPLHQKQEVITSLSELVGFTQDEYEAALNSQLTNTNNNGKKRTSWLKRLLSRNTSPSINLTKTREGIIPEHHQLAIRNDQELNKLREDVPMAQGGVLPHIHGKLLPKENNGEEDSAGSMESQRDTQPAHMMMIQLGEPMANNDMKMKSIPPAKKSLGPPISQKKSNKPKQPMQQQNSMNNDDDDKSDEDDDDESDEGDDMTTNPNIVTSSSALATTTAMDTTVDDNEAVD